MAEEMRESCSIIIPVYRNEMFVSDLVDALENIQKRLAAPLEVVFVVDGSPDRSFELLVTQLPQATFAARIILLSRNFGAFPAIRIGLTRAAGKYFAVMAADLQEPPELLLEFFRVLANDEADVVIGKRTGREDPWLQQIPSRLFWFIYRRLVQPETPPGGVDVFGCNELVRKELVRLEESNTSLIGLLLWLGFRRKLVSYQRSRRKYGRSSWSLRKRLRYLSDSAFSFTDFPIHVLFFLGSFGVILSAAFSCLVLWAKLSGKVTVPGYSAVILTILFFASLNLLGMGIIGSYLWRAFENTKKRPAALIMKEVAFPR